MKVAIVDYGVGNIKSLVGALKYVGVKDITISSNYDELKKVDKIVLPGVGSFYTAMRNIKERKIDTCIKEFVSKNKTPILGICLGMQLMGISSTEHGESMGLELIDGYINKFNEEKVKVPHVGFNQVEVNPELKLYYNMGGAMDFYFVHSYKMHSDKNINQCLCDYGGGFIASYEVGNIVGVQFHPELSQHNGLQLLKNFIEQF